MAGSSRATPSAPRSAARTRLSSVLNKVAQLESKVMAHKKHLELHNTDSGMRPLAEECTSSASGHEGGARNKKYWKKNYGSTSGSGTHRDACSEEEESMQNPKRSVMVKQQLEEEMRELMESSLGFSTGSEKQKVLVSDAQWDRKVSTNFAGSCISINTFM